MKTALPSLLLLLATLGAVAADDKSAAKPTGVGKPVQRAAPESTGDGWETGSPASVGLNASLVDDMFERVQDGTYKNLHSVLIVKNGKLVIEEYYAGQNGDGQMQVFRRSSLHTLQSVTKSVNSALIASPLISI